MRYPSSHSIQLILLCRPNLFRALIHWQSQKKNAETETKYLYWHRTKDQSTKVDDHFHQIFNWFNKKSINHCSERIFFVASFVWVKISKNTYSSFPECLVQLSASNISPSTEYHDAPLYCRPPQIAGRPDCEEMYTGVFCF